MRRNRVLLLLLILGMGSELPGAERFSYPQPGRQFVFPRDHGSHPDFKIEWWYVTGHLWSGPNGGRRFGFQATFFRSAGEHPGGPETESPETFSAEPIYLAHMAILDVSSGQFLYEERLNRSGWDASSSVHTLDVRNGSWSLRFADVAASRMQLEGGVRSDALFSLSLTPARALVSFGRDGVSRKGADPLSSSYYITFPRLAAEGSLRLGNEEFPVHGEAWMDHEISTSQLTAEQVGWDWAAIQLRDGREIMAYRMRLQNGATDPYSTLAWIEKEGQPRHFGPEQFTWKPLQSWKSPHTGAEYPSGIEIGAPDPKTGGMITLRLLPLARDQELAGGLGGVAYWEGACRVLNERGEEIGSAFLELTGYAGKISALQ